MGNTSVSLALALCCHAKNSLMTRNGSTAEEAVIGRSLRFTELSTVDDGDVVLVAVLRAHGPAWRASQIRAAAILHVLQSDASDNVRRAMLRKAPVVLGELCPGSRVYFWTPVINRGRNRRGSDIWRGPAIVIDRQGAIRCFIAYRAKVLFVTREQMRHATSMRSAVADRIAEDMGLVSQDRDHTYHYIADEDAIPTVTAMRMTPRPLPRVTDTAGDDALRPCGNAMPIVIRASRAGSRCSACGRFGHEQGDPECVQASGVPALRAPPASPDVDDAGRASDADMDAVAREIATYDQPAPDPVESDAVDVPVTESDEELSCVDAPRAGTDERRRKVRWLPRDSKAPEL